MARVTVEDCLENVKNRFELVLISSKRARQIAQGAEPLVAVENDKPTVVALREIAEGLIDAAILDETVVESAEWTSEEEVTAELENVLLGLTSGGTTQSEATKALTDIASVIAQNASTLEADLNAENAAIIDAAKAEGEKAIGQSTTALASALGGSTQNTLLQLMAAEANNDLTVQLAGLNAELTQQNAVIASEEFNNVVAALSAASASGVADTTAVVALADILKGATVTSTGEQITTTEEQQFEEAITLLNEIVAELTLKDETVDSTGTATSTTTGTATSTSTTAGESETSGFNIGLSF